MAGAGGRGVSEGEEKCDGVGRERRNGQSVTPWSVAEDRNGAAKMGSHERRPRTRGREEPTREQQSRQTEREARTDR